MIESFAIKNFRCFKDINTTLKRFNVVVGESGSGKTSLLEALFLLGGSSPEIYFRLRNWRGFSNQVTLVGTRESYESLFRDLFYDFDQKQGAVINSYDSAAGTRQLDILFKKKDEYSLDLNLEEGHAFLISPILFKWTVRGKVYDSLLEFKEGKFTVSGVAPVAPLVYLNSNNFSTHQNTASLSALNRKFQAGDLVNAINSIFPQVTDLSLELVGGETAIHVSTNLSQMLPLGDLSGGVNKFISIALAILANPGGAVIVDEFESGFYYKNMSAIWSALVKLCIDADVQLIVTTHSYEFLKTVASSLSDESLVKQMQFMRLEKDEEGGQFIKKITPNAFASAMDYEIEVR